MGIKSLYKDQLLFNFQHSSPRPSSFVREFKGPDKEKEVNRISSSMPTAEKEMLPLGHYRMHYLEPKI